MDAYLALIHPPENGSSYGVVFPDVPGCVSAGESFTQALANAEEALSGHLALLRADGDPIPAPRSLEALQADPEVTDDARGGVWAAVVPHALAAPRERINIMIDRALLRAVDAAAEAVGKTRSGLIEAALRAHIEREPAGQFRPVAKAGSPRRPRKRESA